MKIYKFDIKKCFSLFICAILFISNTQGFCQELNRTSNIISPEEIKELSALAKNISAKYKKTSSTITSTSSYIDYINSGNAICSSRNPYASDPLISNPCKLHYKEINELAEDLQVFQNRMREVYTKYLDALPKDTYLQKVTANYINDRINTLFSKQNQYLEKLLSISDVLAEHTEIEDISSSLKSVYFHSEKSRQEYLMAQYARDSRLRNSFIGDLAEYQTYYQKAFTEDVDRLLYQLQQAESSFSQEAIEFFSKQTHTSEEILNYFASRLPEEQRATLFALKVSDESLTIKHLVSHIRYYLKQTNRRLWKLDKFSAEKLSIALSKMSLTERVNFVDDLLGFTPETKLLRSEIRQAERAAGKKLVSRGSIKLSGIFMAIGAFLIASTITAMTADNSFSNSIGPAQLAKIGHKINNGELISLQEMSAYYTDPRNYQKVKEDPLGLFEVFEIAITINDCLDQLQIAYPSPDLSQVDIDNAFDTYINNMDLEKIALEIGTV